MNAARIGIVKLILAVSLASGCDKTATSSSPEPSAAPPAVAAHTTTKPTSTAATETRAMTDQTPGKIEKIQKTDAEWKAQLTETQYEILRKKGTERAFTGEYWNEFREGTYVCAGCGLALYRSSSKYDAECGWPSFSAPISQDRIEKHRDTSLFTERTEIVCPRCGGHLGHVFDDGPTPTGMRHCVNSASIKFVPKSAAAPTSEKPAPPTKEPTKP